MSSDRTYSGRPLRVMPATAYPEDKPYRAFRRAVELDRLGIHTVTDRADDADIILFIQGSPWRTDSYFRKLLGYPLVRRFSEKCFMHIGIEGLWTKVPGRFGFMPRFIFSPTRHRACAYLTEPNPWIRRDTTGVPYALFTFLGRQSDPIRRQLLDLRHERGCLRDTCTVYQQWGYQDQAAMRPYTDTLVRGKFDLCPRGRGPASYRLFESMRVGRVPVIISDDWVAPEGPMWNTCAVRIAEADIPSIPSMLESLELRWPEIAAAAAQTWDDWFAPDVLFTRMVDDCALLLEQRRVPERWRRLIPDRPYLKMRAEAAIDRVRRRISPGSEADLDPRRRQ